jgi:hypothetical protein
METILLQAYEQRWLREMLGWQSANPDLYAQPASDFLKRRGKKGVFNKSVSTPKFSQI